jgi:hypothetical protein
MKRTGLVAGPLLVLSAMILAALPALAQEGDLEPAIPIEPQVESATALDWTYRYLIPTALVIAVAVVIMTTVRYFTNVVRSRYRIVEE